MNNKTHNIPLANYEGYIWKSDQPKPEVLLNKEYEQILTDGENPFVIEGFLFSAEALKSFSIKYVDGRYLVNEYSVATAEIDEATTYIASNRMKNVKGLKMLRRWVEREDPGCPYTNAPDSAYMKVLQPRELIFVGFEIKEEKEDAQ
ncbi:TIGR04423 family type III CRISPR-associated protein [Bacteroides sp. OttesenSCG-928-E20]|nr:TIGR04423 family type III CRISPR-associated protein [Bacteroides sp. OttesenSCG-928-N06]MDL2299161.1 TIGR04423 family type III CRISPR-associated protein [Bacteroides sp. OttesenSCG-928-E20]MDL2304648.1 TIGR04423 family type III CRISPR-associated protein [Bacteroides sp. OttesenSCG-928-D19]